MKRIFRRLVRRGEVGQSIIILAIGFIGLLAVVGLTTDISLMFAQYSQLRRAVDSAAIAAAGQIRQDQDIVASQLAAKQFIEFHGLEPTEVEVLTCEMLPVDERTPEANPDVCTADQRKLVRVTAWVEPPTIFLRLLGLSIPPLSATAISETAVLEVVVIMDVSESMLQETTYQDWGAVGLGMGYVPPRLSMPSGVGLSGSAVDDVLGGTVSFPQYNEAIYSRMMDYDNPADPAVATNRNGVIPVFWPWDENANNTPDMGDFLTEDNFSRRPNDNYWPNASLASTTAVYEMNGSNTEYGSWRDWFFKEFHLGVSQATVNERLYFLPDNATWTTEQNLAGVPFSSLPADIDSGASPSEFPADRDSMYYAVRSFTPDYPGNLETELGAQDHPRPECRVRYFPYSYNQSTTDTSSYLAYRDEEDRTNDFALDQLYRDNNAPWGYWTQDRFGNPGDRFYGFVPTYNFYGCCNDPGTFTDEGAFVGTGADGNFNDLICQPFKKARDATELFLDRIDFARGDRVAFVTFDRSAFLIDPDGTSGPSGPLIDNRDLAVQTLREDIGVRAEPSFYVWNDIAGSWSHDVTVPDGDDYTGPVFAQGIDATTGQSIPAYYHLPDWEADRGPRSATIYGENGFGTAVGVTPSNYNNYPVISNCEFWNATLQAPFTRSSERTGTAPLLDNNFLIPQQDVATLPNSDNQIDPTRSYQLRGQCRGTNIGGALRTAASALTDPAFGARVEGSVWVMVLLGDGAAGASNPVRSIGERRDPSLPYLYGGAGGTLSLQDARGEYGAYGLCPITETGELYREDSPGFPYCSDPVFYTRHFCTGDGVPGLAPGVGETGFYPNALDNNYDINVRLEEQLNAVYDVDIGVYGEVDGCSEMYDVDDYARDWADFITGIQRDDWFVSWRTSNGPAPNDFESRDPRAQTGGDATLPTIFTIGFGLNFNNGRVGDEPGTCEENVPDCLGEELLRYIADAGDNFTIDNDYQQYLLGNVLTNIEGDFPAVGDPATLPDGLNYGPPDPCQATGADAWDPTNGGVPSSLTPTESCGNYYNAPNQEQLEEVFDDIASRMFTRLSG